MGIYKLPNGHYRVQVMVNRERYDKVFDTLKEAEEYENFIQRNRNTLKSPQDVLIKKNTITIKIDDLLEGYEKEKQQYINDKLCRMDKMSDSTFEEYCIMLLQMADVFPNSTYTKTKKNGDYGADIIANQCDKVKVSIRCKRYDNSSVKVQEIQKVVTSKKYYGTNKCMVITNTGFTDSAVSLALVNDVLLIDRQKLIKLIELEYANGKKIASGKYWEELCEILCI